jgi:hypothetical protein
MGVSTLGIKNEAKLAFLVMVRLINISIFGYIIFNYFFDLS